MKTWTGTVRIEHVFTLTEAETVAFKGIFKDGHNPTVGELDNYFSNRLLTNANIDIKLVGEDDDAYFEAMDEH